MSDEQALWAAIRATSDDCAPWLAMADLLDERGDPRGASVRRAGQALAREAMESWRYVFRVGYGPLLPLGGLGALRNALEQDDPRLIQGANTTPPPLLEVQDWPIEATDCIGFCGWQDDGLNLKTVGEVEEFWARHAFEADQALKEVAGCRWFLNWYDDTPRDEMRRELLQEVELAIYRRGLGRVR